MPLSHQQANALTANSGTFVAGASAQLVPANLYREELNIEVDPSGTGTVYLLLGTGTASATNWHIALAPGGNFDGSIGTDTTWMGAVQFFSAGTPRVAVTEV